MALTYGGEQSVGVGVMSVCVLMFIISSLFVYAAKISIFPETAKQDNPFYDKLISGGVIIESRLRDMFLIIWRLIGQGMKCPPYFKIVPIEDNT